MAIDKDIVTDKNFSPKVISVLFKVSIILLILLNPIANYEIPLKAETTVVAYPDIAALNPSIAILTLFVFADKAF